MSTPPPYEYSKQQPHDPQNPYGQQQPPAYGQPGYGQPNYDPQQAGYNPPPGGYADPNAYPGAGGYQQQGAPLPPYTAYPPQQPGGFGMPPQQPYGGGPVASYMWLSILMTVLSVLTCSWLGVGLILGIVAIVFSSRVNGLLAAGNYEGARSSARVARIVNFVNVALIVVYFALLILAVAGSWSINSSI